MIDYSKFVENSRKWLASYIKANHLQSLVIGVSGGIDSTVSCVIAYPVCKELNIPFIVGVDNATTCINSGDYVRMNANNGKVKILKRSKKKK